MSRKYYDNLLRAMAITLEFVLYNIIYIVLYSSALLIFINDCMLGVVVYFIASHVTLNIVATNIVISIRSKLKPAKKTTVLQILYKVAPMVISVIILISTNHWYLATITIITTILSIWFYWKHTTIRKSQKRV